MSPRDEHYLGTCCSCGCEPTLSNPVRTLVMLDYKMPPGFGSGWGCFVCGLASEGATAVICDHCAEQMRFAKAEVRFIMTGVHHKRGRCAITEFVHVPHTHNVLAHAQADEDQL